MSSEEGKVASIFSYFLVRLSLYLLVFAALFIMPMPKLDAKLSLRSKSMASESVHVSLERPQVKKRVEPIKKIIKKPKPKKIVPKPPPKPKKIVAVAKVPEVVVEEEPIQEQAPQETISEETQAVSIAPSQANINEINAYESYMRDMIYSKKRYPIKSRRMRQEGTVKVRFVVNKNGKIIECDILKSSGFNTLDQATEKLFERIDTFKPPPKEMPTPKELIITIQYTLQ